MKPSETYVVGVDGGGSGCRAAIADASGQILGTGEAGAANATTDYDQAVAQVQEAMAKAATDAGLSTDFHEMPAHIGLAGILSEADASRLHTSLGLQNATVTDDRPTNLAGALGQSDGLLAAIGTGSFVGAVSQGNMRFLGGWGLQVGDQASGAWLGRALLEQVLLAHDGMTEASSLTKAVLKTFSQDPNAIVAFARDAQPADFAALSPEITDAAQSGDPVAEKLMTRGSQYLSRAMKTLDPGPDTPICLTGGLGPTYSDWIDPTLAARMVPPLGTALDGALKLARNPR